jgi:hypothetical protein
MSIRNVPVVVCDGCGATIEMSFYIRIQPARQPVVQKDPTRSPERDFCCEACEAWWKAQFPASGPWGPAWDEREWWCQEVGPCADHVRVRTARDVMPLVDVQSHFDKPEEIPIVEIPPEPEEREVSW